MHWRLVWWAGSWGGLIDPAGNLHYFEVLLLKLTAPFACVANLALIRRGVRLAHRQTRLCPQVVPCLGLRCTRATRVLAPLLARALG